MNTNVQTKTVTVIESINLNLSLEGAVALLLLTHCSVIGSEDSFRGVTNEIAESLSEAGVSTEGLEYLSKGIVEFQPFGYGHEAVMERMKEQIVARASGDITKIQDKKIDEALRSGNRIAAIKRLRELSYHTVNDKRVCAGLKEAKDEIDRRW